MNAYFAIDRQYEIDCANAEAHESWAEQQDLIELAECIDLESLLWAVLKSDKEAINHASIQLNARLEERWQAHLKDCEDSKWDAAINDFDLAECF